jgi:hypothetical protein
MHKKARIRLKITQTTTPEPCPTCALLKSIPATLIAGMNELTIPNNIPEIAAIHPSEATAKLIMIMPVTRRQIMTTELIATAKKTVIRIPIPPGTLVKLYESWLSLRGRTTIQGIVAPINTIIARTIGNNILGCPSDVCTTELEELDVDSQSENGLLMQKDPGSQFGLERLAQLALASSTVQ